MEIVILYLASLGFTTFFFQQLIKGINENSHKMFVEFVKAIKAPNLNEYVATLPEEGEVEVSQDDEIMELSELPPEKLLKLIRKE